VKHDCNCSGWCLGLAYADVAFMIAFTIKLVFFNSHRGVCVLAEN
jgi:hypothetical protein